MDADGKIMDSPTKDNAKKSQNFIKDLLEKVDDIIYIVGSIIVGITFMITVIVGLFLKLKKRMNNVVNAINHHNGDNFAMQNIPIRDACTSTEETRVKVCEENVVEINEQSAAKSESQVDPVDSNPPPPPTPPLRDRLRATVKSKA